MEHLEFTMRASLIAILMIYAFMFGTVYCSGKWGGLCGSNPIILANNS
jgi:hypothetical protein